VSSSATGYSLNDRGDKIRVPVEKYFSPIYVAKTGSGAQPPAECFLGALSPVANRRGRKSDYSLPTCDGIKNTWTYTLLSISL
jgi:hypothetical protein